MSVIIAIMMTSYLSYVPPSSVNWNNAGGYVPDTQGGSNPGMILLGNHTFTGCTGIGISSSGGGIISALSIDGTGRLVFDYTAPYVDPDTLTITGTNAVGGAISIPLSVDLPF